MEKLKDWISLQTYKHYCSKHSNNDITCKDCNFNFDRNHRIDNEEVAFNNLLT